jgi:ABC-2 type transport system ATP-binding protein
LRDIDGVTVDALPGGTLRVSGMDLDDVGEIAFHNNIMVRELTAQTASLETAFITATAEAEEYVAHQLTGGAA